MVENPLSADSTSGVISASDSPRHWYEADHARLVSEVEAIQSEFPHFTWSLQNGCLCCEGDVMATLPEGDAPALIIRLTYPSGFPAAPIRVLPNASQIPADLWGHDWHRWDDGSLCLGHPNQWDISYTGRDVIEKASEWYFNFLAKVLGKVEQMPDVGRAVLMEQRDAEQDLNRLREQEAA